MAIRHDIFLIPNAEERQSKAHTLPLDPLNPSLAALWIAEGHVRKPKLSLSFTAASFQQMRSYGIKDVVLKVHHHTNLFR
jgi:hypothetical protein